MKLYIYAQTGHNFGLENLKRCVAIHKKLNHQNPMLATSDFRAVTFAKEVLGVSGGVGVDIIENLPNIMQRGDSLIFDSFEPSDTLKEHMKEFCDKLFEVGIDIPYDIVDDIYFKKVPQKYEKALFFADDDYENEMLEFCNGSQKQDMILLLGYYFFIGNEDKLAPYFDKIIESEDYVQTIKATKYLLTASVQSALESLVSGNCPVFFKRKLKEFKGEIKLLEKYNIPIIDGKNLDELVREFEKIIKNYPRLNSIKKIDLDDLKMYNLGLLEI